MTESTVWRVMNWLIAQWVLSIWNPDLMNFVTSPTRKRSLKNFYRAKGIVLHDRALNGERFFS